MKLLRLVFPLAFALWVTPCRAGDAAADALFRAGREAAERGDDATACARFAESHRLEPAAGTVFNLALCLERRGQLASAWQRFREARDRLTTGDERARLCEEHLLALEPRLSKLTLRIVAGAEGAKVSLDGVELGAASLGVALPLDAGTHEVVVTAPARAERRWSFSVQEGQDKELMLEPGAAASSASPATASAVQTPAAERAAPSSAAARAEPGRTLGFVFGGIGAASLVTSLVSGVLVIDRKNTVDRECDASGCSRAGVNAASSGRTLSTLSTVAFVTGVVGVGVGFYLVLSSKPKPESAELELSTLPGAASVRLLGHF